jgi:hypothetical protein
MKEKALKRRDVNLTLTPASVGADHTRVAGEPQSLQARIARKFPKGFRQKRKR